jgi:hypothetical protein
MSAVLRNQARQRRIAPAGETALCYLAFSDELRMRLRSKLGVTCVIAYVTIFLFAEFLAFRALIFDTANSELSGVPATFVTLPWSIMLGPIWDLTGFAKWYDRFARTPPALRFFCVADDPAGRNYQRRHPVLYRQGD